MPEPRMHVVEELDGQTGAMRIVLVTDPPLAAGEYQRQEVYVRPDGSLFNLPIDDASRKANTASTSHIGRTVFTAHGPKNIYLAKGFRFATKADYEKQAAKTKANELIAAERAKARDPVTVEEMRAKIMAKAVTDMVGAAQNAHQQRGGK